MCTKMQWAQQYAAKACHNGTVKKGPYLPTSCHLPFHFLSRFLASLLPCNIPEGGSEPSSRFSFIPPDFRRMLTCVCGFCGVTSCIAPCHLSRYSAIATPHEIGKPLTPVTKLKDGTCGEDDKKSWALYKGDPQYNIKNPCCKSRSTCFPHSAPRSLLHTT